MRRRKAALATLLALSLATTGAPVAWAEDAAVEDGTNDETIAVGDTELVEVEGAVAVQAGEAVATARETAELAASTLATTRSRGLVSGLSDEFKYFTRYESSCNYDQGFSYGDGYHAVGYYQFDNRYSLQAFLQYCYEYDGGTFSMFAFAMDEGVDIASSAMYDYGAGRLTDLGQRIEDAWHAAYAAAPGTFAALQDTYAYNNYYLTAENYLKSQGIDISGRADCVKGLCWGVCNLFGSGGWRQFVGGHFNGTYHEGCGLDADMSDAEFVVALTQYIIDHVGEFYPSQSQYHQGWQNRYRNEQAECLRYLPDVVSGAWYAEPLAFAQSNGLLSGYSSGPMAGRIGPDDRITRGQIAVILYRWATGGASDGSLAYRGYYTDVSSSDYYAEAANWAYENRIILGYEGNGGRSFGGDDYATREQLAVIFARYAESMGRSTVVVSNAAYVGMPDYADSSAYAVDSLMWCCEQGIIRGYTVNGENYLRPQGSATRIQFVAMLMRLVAS